MNKILLILGTVALSTNFVFASIDQNLKYGQKGQEVSELQEFLADKGFLTASPSGFFGLLTLKAVKAYQVSQNLPSTGYVGAMTREAINKEISLELADSTAAEVSETGTTTPVQNPVATTTIIYVPTYYPTPVNTGGVAEPMVSTPKETYTIRTDNTSYNYAWFQGEYTLNLSGSLVDSHNQTTKEYVVTCTSPSGVSMNGTFSPMAGVGWVFRCDGFTGSQKGTYTYTISVPDLGLTKDVEVKIN